MMSVSHSIVWINYAVAGVAAGVLLLVVVGLLYVRGGTRREGNRLAGGLWGRIEARVHGARMFVEVDQLDRARTLTIQAVLQRGWTPEMVERVLGIPDYAVLDPQRRQEPLKLYNRERVLRAERGKRFRTFQAETAARHARSEAQLRKWLELREVEKHDGA